MTGGCASPDRRTFHPPDQRKIGAMQLEPYWLASRTPFIHAEQGDLPSRASVVVIGGGLTGLAAARTLALGGADAVLLEADIIGGAASGRNGGQCNNGIATDFGALIQRLGMDAARAIYGAFNSAVDKVEAIVADEAIDCDFVRNGKLKLADKPEHAAKLVKAVELLQREVDPEAYFVDRANLKREIVSDAFHGGIVFPRSASLHVGRLTCGLADAAVRHGAVIYEHTPVTGMKRLGGGAHQIATPRGTITVDAVLLATGASMKGPFSWLRRRIVPVGSFVIATEPLTPGQIDRLMPGRRNFTTSRHIGNYFRLTADDRLIFGGRARFALSNPVNDAKGGEILQARLRKVFPELAGLPVAHTWGGVLDMTTDRLPRAGVRDGVHYAVGLSGHGVQMSVFLGDRMADVIVGKRQDQPFSELAWPAVPGHFGRPWFLPLIGAYYHYLDWRY
jgi:glycine/D-amino acid oxidase-like deaminating enzyme